MSSNVKIEIPEFLNIGVACTSAHVGTAKENSIAMVIEDDKLGTDEITYKDLATKSDQVCNFFTGIGLEPRDRVLVCLKNSLAYPISFFGTMKAGIIAVPTSTLLSGSEVKYLAEDSQARAIVLSASMYENLVPYLENLDNLKTIVIAGIDSVDGLKKPKDINIYALNEIFNTVDKTPNHYNSKSGEPAYLVYTSGTTGYPKGVLHSHRSLVGRTPATKFWFDFKENDRIMHSGKFNWTYVLGSALMDPLFNGHTVIAYEGANDASTWINLIKKHQCTIFIGVPTIYRQIIQKTDFTLEDFGSHFDFIFRHSDNYTQKYPERVTLWQEILKEVFDSFPNLRVLLKRDPAWNRDSFHCLKPIIIKDTSYHCVVNSLLYKPLGGDSFKTNYIGDVTEEPIYENEKMIITGDKNISIKITKIKDFVDKYGGVKWELR